MMAEQQQEHQVCKQPATAISKDSPLGP